MFLCPPVHFWRLIKITSFFYRMECFVWFDIWKCVSFLCVRLSLMWDWCLVCCIHTIVFFVFIWFQISLDFQTNTTWYKLIFSCWSSIFIFQFPLADSLLIKLVESSTVTVITRFLIKKPLRILSLLVNIIS